MTESYVLAGIETGGTKILVRAIDERGAVVANAAFPTTTPNDAVARIAKTLRLKGSRPPIRSLGIASFGPVCLDPQAADYGRILATPKPGWSGFDLREAVLNATDAHALAIDTDVNAAALAEARLGAGKGCDSVAYVTVGTGIGGGYVSAGRTLKGVLHPEVGHLRVRRAAHDSLDSLCPFHADCVEGLAAGPAVGRRLGSLRRLEDAPEVLALVTDYLAQLCEALVLAWAPHAIVMGGGVTNVAGLLDMVHGALSVRLGDYGPAEAASHANYLRIPSLAPESGLIGALEMARDLV